VLPIGFAAESSIVGCRFRFGVAEDFLEELMATTGQGRPGDVLASRDISLKLHTEPDSFQADVGGLRAESLGTEPIGRYAAIQQGTALVADLELLDRTEAGGRVAGREGKRGECQTRLGV
jgi:hypothetical protein